MIEWFESLSTLESAYVISAIVGSIAFVIRMVMMFIGIDGGDGDADVHGDVHGDVGDAHGVDHDGSGHDGSDSDISFSLLSFQGLTAFFMMFGLVGLAMSRGSGLGALLSIPVATGAGLLTVWVISKLFKLFNSLQHSGTLNLDNALGQEGKIYLTIPENDTGQVQVAIQGHLKIMNAVSEDRRAIPTDERVVITNVTSGNVLVVRKL